MTNNYGTSSEKKGPDSSTPNYALLVFKVMQGMDMDMDISNSLDSSLVCL